MSGKRGMGIGGLEKMIDQRVAAALAAAGMQVGSTSSHPAHETGGTNKMKKVKKEQEEEQEIYPTPIGYPSGLPYCDICEMRHPRICEVKCGRCEKKGHRARDCEPLGKKGLPKCAFCGEREVSACPENCPRKKKLKLEKEFWELEVKGHNLEAYNKRFEELSTMCPDLVTPEYMKISRYIWGLPVQAQLYLSAGKRGTMEAVKETAKQIMEMNWEEFETAMHEQKEGPNYL